MSDDAILKEIFSRLQTGQNLAIIAPYSPDRVNLLRRIGDPENVVAWLPSKSRWAFLFLSAADFSSDATAEDFWKKLWQGFEDRLSGTPWQSTIGKLAHARRPSDAEHVLRSLTQDDVRLVLLFEGMDRLTENSQMFTSDFLAPLRSLSSRHKSFSIVLSSQLPLTELNRLAAMAGSPAFNVFLEIFQEPLS